MENRREKQSNQRLARGAMILVFLIWLAAAILLISNNDSQSSDAGSQSQEALPSSTNLAIDSSFPNTIPTRPANQPSTTNHATLDAVRSVAVANAALPVRNASALDDDNRDERGANIVGAIVNMQVTCDFDIADGDVPALISAINVANVSAGADTICLAPDSTYTLTTVNNTLNGATGLPLITSDITIVGNNAIIERDVAAPDFRILFVEAIGMLMLDNVTLQNGRLLSPMSLASGGAVASIGTLHIANSTITNNEAHNAGGLHFVNESGSITNSIVSNNTAVDTGGGIGVRVFSNVITITDSTISGNQVTNVPSFGGGIFVDEGEVALTGSTVSNNYTTLAGGGVYVFQDALLTLGDTTVGGGAANTAEFGGGIYNAQGGTVNIVNNSLISNNTVTGDGGGIYNDGGTLTVTNSEISGNQAAGFGGGIFSSEFSTLTLTNSTVDNNVAEQGGGVASRGNGTITNSTISGNDATTEGGGIHVRDDGDSLTAIAQINFSTIVDNDAPSGAGIFILGAEGGGLPGNTVEIKNSIVANNLNGGDCVSQTDAVLTPFGANIDSDGTCGFSIIGDPILGPLQDNGGSTFTHAIVSASSPALSAATDCTTIAGAPVTTDQRGQPRSAVCDLGAYEADITIATPSATYTPSPSSTPTPTSTATATSTATPTSTSTPTNTPTSTATPTALPVTITDKPVLLSPANKSFTNDNTPQLVWSSVAGAASYDIQIDDDKKFRSIDQSVNVAGTDYTAAILPDGRWFWRVRGVNSIGEPGEWSKKRRFTVDTFAPAVPNLNVPINGAVIESSKESFKWNKNLDVDVYEIRLDTMSPPTFIAGETSKNKFNPPLPLLTETYYWQVRAIDKAGNVSAWSEMRMAAVVSRPNAAPQLQRFSTPIPTLTWNPLSWAVQYEIQIDNSSKFNTSLLQWHFTNANTLSVMTQPLADGIWNWRVRAQATDGSWSEWSDVQVFIVDT